MSEFLDELMVMLTISFDVSDVESGFYFVRVKSNEGYQSIKRLIVEH
jgi:hypothetical protein